MKAKFSYFSYLLALSILGSCVRLPPASTAWTEIIQGKFLVQTAGEVSTGNFIWRQSPTTWQLTVTSNWGLPYSSISQSSKLSYDYKSSTGVTLKTKDLQALSYKLFGENYNLASWRYWLHGKADPYFSNAGQDQAVSSNFTQGPWQLSYEFAKPARQLPKTIVATHKQKPLKIKLHIWQVT